MALATQCPHCQTTFRVVNDQLKLRAGLVRCGQCKQIFNGIEHLLPSSDVLSPPAPTTQSVAQPADSASLVTGAVAAKSPSAEPPHALAESTHSSQANSDNQPSSEHGLQEQEPQAFSTAASPASVMPTSRLSFAIPSHFEREPADTHSGAMKPEDPLQRMTLLDFARPLPDSFDDLDARTQAAAEAHAEKQDELDKVMDDMQDKPWRDDSADDELMHDEEPGFVRQERSRRQMSSKLRNVIIAACCLLVISALLQAGYTFRNQLAGIFPQTKPVLTALCTSLGCRIDLPTNIAAVSIESSDLQTQGSERNAFVLNALLRNASSLAQEWPSIELTLNDAAEKPVLRRVFAPHDYLQDQAILRTGLAATTEHTVRIAFELEEAGASGYRVYLFYP